MTRRAITLLGMSGVGKTTVSTILADAGWCHFSCDHRIGTHYLEDEIIRHLTRKIEQLDDIKLLIDNGTIRISGQITIENLFLLSQFVGKIGNPEQDGMPYDEFRRRQSLYYEAEIQSVKDAVTACEQEERDFVCDSTGSLCELPDDTVSALAGVTDFVYIEASEDDEKMLIERAKAYPKPLFYPAAFLDDALKEYMAEKSYDYIALIEPDDFCRWVFPKLFYARLPKYKNLAQKYGVIISSKDILKVKTADDFCKLLQDVRRDKAEV